jgi:hypothetical protein
MLPLNQGGDMKRLGAIVLLAFSSTIYAQSPGVPQQIAALETRMTNAETRLTSAETRLSSAEAQLSDAEAFAATQAAQIVALKAEVVPVGTIITYSAEVPPAGYLECDGNEIFRSDYPALFAAISTAFGMGDGASTFRVPDLRGLFVRGWSHDSPFGLDPDRASRATLYPGGATGDHVGSFQYDLIRNHQHPVFSAALNGFGPFAPVAGGNASGFTQGSTGDAFGGGNESRPRNVSMMYAIKY